MKQVWGLSGVLLLGACATAPDAETTITVWSRLPGATVTLEDASATLDEEGATMLLPAIRGSSTVLRVEAGGATLELPVAWSADYAFLGLPEDTALDALTIAILRGEDGACVLGTTNGRAAGHAWSGMFREPVSACGPLGLVGFRRDHGASPCTDGADCVGFEEISGDGTLRIDPLGEPGAPVVEALLDGADLARVRVALTEPALMDALRAACPPGGDASETMELAWLLESAESDTAGCEAPELVPVRALLDELVSRYR